MNSAAMMIYDDIISGKKQEVGKKRGGSELILGDNNTHLLVTHPGHGLFVCTIF